MIALAWVVIARLTATLNSLMMAGVMSLTSTPREVASAFCKLPRWSMAAAAMMPRSLDRAFMRFNLPAEGFMVTIMAPPRALQSCAVLVLVTGVCLMG